MNSNNNNNNNMNNNKNNNNNNNNNNVITGRGSKFPKKTPVLNPTRKFSEFTKDAVTYTKSFHVQNLIQQHQKHQE